MKIVQAGMQHLDGVLGLHKRYHISSIDAADKPGGFVTTNFIPEQLSALVEKEHGITIAMDGDDIIAYAMAASWQFWSEWALFAHMIEKLPENTFHGQMLSVDNSYQYGPICIDRQYRSSGLFQKVFFASLAAMADRYSTMVTFINRINGRSCTAHTKKAGMDVVCEFQFNQNNYYMLACPTKF